MTTKPDYIRPELLEAMQAYRLVTDCYMGERHIKGLATTNSNGARYNGGGYDTGFATSPYLPDPSPPSEDLEFRKKRYHDYLTRAVFYNVTKRTVKGMAGAVFSKYPTFDLGGMNYLETDIDGAGQSLAQQAKDAFTLCLLKGRGGLLADIAVTDEVVSKSDMVANNIRPYIRNYDSESIINWRTGKVGGVVKNTLIVLAGNCVASDDGFKQEMGAELLILRLDNGVATSEVMRKGASGWTSLGVKVLKDYRGQALTEIPFYPYGSVNNDLEIDDSPMYDIAQLNVAHFRDSADYQEANFIAGQPTLILTGLTPEWIKDTLGGKVTIGSRNGVMLPMGGTAQLLQAQPNGSIMEGMLHKEKQMTALGAKLIENSKQAKTATEAAQDSAEESNTLTNIAYNVSDAYTKAVKACARYVGVDDTELVVALNTTFNFAKMTPEQRAQLISEWQVGAITWGEMRAQLIESEVAIIEDDDKAEQTIKREQGALVSQERMPPKKENEDGF